MLVTACVVHCNFSFSNINANSAVQQKNLAQDWHLSCECTHVMLTPTLKQPQTFPTQYVSC